jgi:DNA-binding response OmpR family regulator
MDGPTVLLIDSDRDSLNIYSLILRHHGFRVLLAEDGDAGIALACESQPDLIVLEPFVPGVRGLPLLELLRDEERTARLRVLLVTSVPSMVDRLTTVVPWADRYLVKPCQPRYFLAEVQRRLEPALSAA